MNKKNLLLLGVVLIVCAGCAAGQEKVEGYIDNPSTLLTDPHYATFTEKSDALEHQYLSKEITYAEYQERRKELDKQYTAEVQHREAILSDHPPK